MKTLNLQISKIVGGPDERFWSQVHVFLATDKEKKYRFGHLLACFSLEAKKEQIDIASFGKEVIARLHEIYYSSSEKKALLRLSSSLKALAAEFEERVAIEVVAAVILPSLKTAPLAYLAAKGKGRAYIWRQAKLVKLLAGAEGKVTAVSGFLKDNDWLVLGTKEFFQAISLGTLRAALENKEVEEGGEFLAPIVHGYQNNSQAAAVIFKVKAGPLVKKKIKKPLKTFFRPMAFSQLRIIFKAAGQAIKRLKSQPSFYLKDEERRKKAKKTTLTVALILIGLLIISVIFGLNQKSASQEEKVMEMITQEAGYKYDQAVSLEEINPLRAKSLLTEARDLLQEKGAMIEDKEMKKKINKLWEQISRELEKVAREYKLDKAAVFLDLNLAKEGFKGDDWDLAEESLYIFDRKKKTVLAVNTKNKSYQMVAGGQKLAAASLIGAVKNRVFIFTGQKLLLVDALKAEVVDEAEAEGWGEIKDLVGFSRNAYLLDSEKNQIWKYRGLNIGFSAKGAYLKGKNNDLSGAVSLAIDGSVWVLFNNGQLVKFTRGVKDAFVVSGLDKPLSDQLKLYTDEKLDSLYILDRKNTRVVVISKETGEYQAQYIWPGIAGAIDLVALEEPRKILLLTGDRIYEIEIRD